MSKELKLCPFCGKEPKLFIRGNDEFSYDVGCGTSGCYLEAGADWWIGRNDAVEMWNKKSMAV